LKTPLLTSSPNAKHGPATDYSKIKQQLAVHFYKNVQHFGFKGLVSDVKSLETGINSDRFNSEQILVSTRILGVLRPQQWTHLNLIFSFHSAVITRIKYFPNPRIVFYSGSYVHLSRGPIQLNKLPRAAFRRLWIHQFAHFVTSLNSFIPTFNMDVLYLMFLPPQQLPNSFVQPFHFFVFFFLLYVKSP